MHEQTVLEHLIHWAKEEEAVRALILYSSRTCPGAPVDRFSDYDVLVIVNDIHPYHEDDSWLQAFGPVLVVYRNPIEPEHGFDSFSFITHYQDGTKIDYGVMPVDFLQWAVQAPELPPNLDDGYRVLLDKDGLAAGLKPPTYTAYIPKPPTEKQYLALIEEFFNDALYVAKNICRDNLFAVKLSLDYIMKYQCLRKLLEWRMEIERGWSARPGSCGKGLKQRTVPEIWAALESTYVGAGTEENWEALFKTIDLFRRIAVEVGEKLGYAYPYEQDRGVTGMCRRRRVP